MRFNQDYVAGKIVEFRTNVPLHNLVHKVQYEFAANKNSWTMVHRMSAGRKNTACHHKKERLGSRFFLYRDTPACTIMSSKKSITLVYNMFKEELW